METFSCLYKDIVKALCYVCIKTFAFEEINESGGDIL